LIPGRMSCNEFTHEIRRVERTKNMLLQPCKSQNI
jgi:hypothetical protein